MERDGAEHRDLLVEIRGAYALHDSLERWLDALTARVSAVRPEQHGAAGRILDTASGATVGDYALHIADPRVHDAFRRHRLVSEHRLDFLLESQGTTGTHSQFNDSRDRYLARMSNRFVKGGVHDMLHVTAHDGHQHWVSLGLVLRRAPEAPWSARAWRVAAGHFETGLRAQAQALALTGALAAGLDPVDRAVPEPATSTVERLRRAARAADGGAHGPATSSERAHQVWLGLLRGTWSRVDRHDHQGRRYVIAVPRNAPRADARALTPREALVAAYASDGRSDKWIGYTVDASRSTVANQLAAALEKLALPSRIALAKAFRGVAPRHVGPAACEAALSLVPASRLRAHPLAREAVVLAFDLDGVPSQLPLPALDTLTPAQRQIATLALQGLGDRDIAQRLGLSRHTVSNQLRRAYARLGVGTRVELGALIRAT